MAPLFVYRNEIRVSREFKKLPVLFSANQLIIQTDEAIRITQEFFIEGLGEVAALPILIQLGKTLIDFSNQFPYRLMVQSSSDRTVSQINLAIWTNQMPLSNPPSFAKPTTVNPVTVAASTTSVALLPANAARVGFTIWNNSPGTLFLEYGATALNSAYAVKIEPSGYFESPAAIPTAIAGIWSATGGSAFIREIS